MVFLVVALIVAFGIGLLLVQCGFGVARVVIYFALLPLAAVPPFLMAVAGKDASYGLVLGAAWIVGAWFVSGLRNS